MIRHNYTFVRNTALSIATAISISIPVSGPRDLIGQPKTPHKKPYKATAGEQKVQASIDIVSIIKELNLTKKIGNSAQTMPNSSNGGDYGTECHTFRTELKGVISDFLAVICVVPALSTDHMLIDNLEAASTLVDYIPAGKLFLMWKTLGEQLGQIQTAVNNFGQDLAVVPPLENFTFFNESTNSYEDSDIRQPDESTRNDVNFTRSLFNRSFVNLFQARIEMYAFRLNSFSDLLPKSRLSTTDTDTHEVYMSLTSSDHLKAPLELIAMTS